MDARISYIARRRRTDAPVGAARASLSSTRHAALAEAATEIMLHVHHRGVGVCGVYTYEVAETKVTQTIDFARRHQHPLQCTMEKE